MKYAKQHREKRQAGVREAQEQHTQVALRWWPSPQIAVGRKVQTTHLRCVWPDPERDVDRRKVCRRGGEGLQVCSPNPVWL